MRLPLLAILIALAGPASAEAATVRVDGTQLSFVAGRGEANDVTISLRGDGYRIVDSSGDLTAGVGCAARADGSASCPAAAIRSAELDTAGLDDTVKISATLRAVVTAGSGDDTIATGPVGSAVLAGSGDDRVFGDSGADVLAGGNGDDTLQGASGDDRILGGEGRDELDGEDGADSLNGGDQDDVLTGGNDADRLEGGDGVDNLEGGLGADVLLGGGGNDVVLAAEGEADDIACGDGRDAGRADAVDRVDLISCEDLARPGDPDGGGADDPLATLQPYPVVRIVGAASGSRTRITRLQVTAPSGTRVHTRCTGAGCPYRSRSRTVREARTVVVSELSRRYRPGAVLEVYVTSPNLIGKYTRFLIRRRRSPRRTDRCVAGERLRPIRCGTG